jgi:hypothetical protein
MYKKLYYDKLNIIIKWSNSSKSQPNIYIYIYINFDSTTFTQIPAKLYLLTFKLIRGDYKIQNIQDTLSPTAPNLETYTNSKLESQTEET